MVEICQNDTQIRAIKRLACIIYWQRHDADDIQKHLLLKSQGRYGYSLLQHILIYFIKKMIELKGSANIRLYYILCINFLFNAK